MGQNWDLKSEHGEGDPIRVSPKRLFKRQRRAEQDQLEARVAQRLDELAGNSEPEMPLSKVEQAMRRNAPDLAGAPEEEILAAQARRNAHKTARWPRPRVMAIFLVWLVAWLHPASTMRIFVLCVMLFLTASIAFGPERARDGAGALWRSFLRLWKVELMILAKLLRNLRNRCEAMFRSAH